ncbi:tetratricopeptide repeat protein [Fulvivirga sediminis]|uniref:Tetratricopeptide repeat protein n=1 Tax=Fulvivirga sediminis TaxID=2803949 RepID=A0A937K084_9BACT|nr:hypothetical protein [Fulvivirga sediminis]MBL3657399.1 hypothetical protein [Fulvivirga sediminis]
MRLHIIVALVLVLSSCLRTLSDKELMEGYQNHSSLGEWEQAYKYVKEGLRRNPNDSSLYFSLALCLNRIDSVGNSEEVLEVLDVYLERYKASILGRLLKHSVLINKGEFEEVIKDVELLEKYYGISSYTLQMKANAYFLNRDWIMKKQPLIMKKHHYTHLEKIDLKH